MNNTNAHRLLAEALGVLESEYEGTDCHQELIEKIREELNRKTEDQIMVKRLLEKINET